ncbi:MAG: TetR/AcrR family transcriptional regulator [Lachnospiraceae bacterium]|nr:TetR/AcrR family transcriptional regulator [Lachnospiraceae bacterium]
MPTKIFTELDEKKQERIIDAALKEFAEYGYENASTNRIVKTCGVSKGSLFKYFENKEELYFYLIDTVSARMAEETRLDINRLSKDLYERVIAYSVTEISWYAANPVKGRFLIGIASESGSDIGRKIIDRYGEKSEDIYETLLKEVDMSGFHNSRREITDILRWVLMGFNSSFLKSISDSDNDIETLKKSYIRQLKRHLQVLKSGL